MTAASNSIPHYNPSFVNFCLHPTQCATSLEGKVTMVALSILFGVSTVGIVHAFVAIWQLLMSPEASKVMAATSPVLFKRKTHPPSETVPQNNVEELVKTTLSAGSTVRPENLQLAKPIEEPKFNESTKFFHTVQNVKLEGNPGDYSFTEIDHKRGILKMTVKGSDGKPFDLLVRKSTSCEGGYRLLIPTKGKFIQSAIFTAAQLGAMINWSRHLPPGFRISSLSALTFMKAGLIIFSKDKPLDEKGHYIVDPKGVLEKVEDQALKALLSCLGIK
jgi:hypothetical protein